jgi:hypothetical protein
MDSISRTQRRTFAKKKKKSWPWIGSVSFIDVKIKGFRKYNAYERGNTIISLFACATLSLRMHQYSSSRATDYRGNCVIKVDGYWLRNWQFQTPSENCSSNASRRWRVLFRWWWSGLYERETHLDLYIGAKIASQLANFIYVFTSIVYGAYLVQKNRKKKQGSFVKTEHEGLSSATAWWTKSVSALEWTQRPTYLSDMPVKLKPTPCQSYLYVEAARQDENAEEWVTALYWSAQGYAVYSRWFRWSVRLIAMASTFFHILVKQAVPMFRSFQCPVDTLVVVLLVGGTRCQLCNVLVWDLDMHMHRCRLRRSKALRCAA